MGERRKRSDREEDGRRQKERRTTSEGERAWKTKRQRAHQRAALTPVPQARKARHRSRSDRSRRKRRKRNVSTPARGGNVTIEIRNIRGIRSSLEATHTTVERRREDGRTPNDRRIHLPAVVQHSASTSGTDKIRSTTRRECDTPQGDCVRTENGRF